MVVLITGSSGFIGRHICSALESAGHEVVGTARGAGRVPATGGRCVAADFSSDFDVAQWQRRLDGVDAVINCVGILRERGRQTFDALHDRAPRALFEACATRGLRRVVQISALGADEHAFSRYHRSKKRADDALLAGPLCAVVVQPALVFGPGGASARLFLALASLPLTPLPGGGAQRVQPIHIDDLAQAIVALLGPHIRQRGRVPLCGPQALSLCSMLAELRRAMGGGALHALPVPMVFVRAAAALGGRMPFGLLDSETLRMLEAGNTADASATRTLLGHDPRPVRAFVSARDAPTVYAAAALAWLLPVLRSSIALVWVATALLSAGLYPVDDSYALLARLGVTGALAPVALYVAAALNLALGIGSFVRSWRPRIWLAQIAVVLAYTALITIGLPEFWRHPYGPILKNLPLLAATLLLYVLDGR